MVNRTLVLALFILACSKKDPEVKLAESATAVSVAPPPPSAMLVSYSIDPTSKTSIELQAPEETIKADTDTAEGKVDIDLVNIENTRGEVKVDLTSLKTHTFDPKTRKDENDSQTDHAHNWLEVGDVAKAEEKKAYRFAVFGIQSVDGASAKDVSKVPALKDGKDDVRIVTATVHGEILIHGHKVKKDVMIEVRLHYPSGASPDSKPTKLEIRNTMPLVVTLAEHDVKPRDNFGRFAEAAAKKLLGTKVAPTASITLNLTASPKT